ncbi:MAG: hypothetical protein O7C67_02685 [Gammaproteobacteria bacterium]|nr:hypothetical protein [Gammaproteobacteria bacterium]
MRRLVLITTVWMALLLGFFLSVPEGRSAEASEAVEVEEPATEPTEPSPDVFLPTEEISEDFAVPFPVDI